MVPEKWQNQLTSDWQSLISKEITKISLKFYEYDIDLDKETFSAIFVHLAGKRVKIYRWMMCFNTTKVDAGLLDKA